MFMRVDQETGQLFLRKGRVVMAAVCLWLAVFDGGTTFVTFSVIWCLQMLLITDFSEGGMLAAVKENSARYAWDEPDCSDFWIEPECSAYSHESGLLRKSPESIDAGESAFVMEFLTGSNLLDITDTMNMVNPASPVYQMLNDDSSFGTDMCSSFCSDIGSDFGLSSSFGDSW